MIDPRTFEPRCTVRGCTGPHFEKGYCEPHHRDKVCPKGDSHTPVPWSVSSCPDGTEIAKCRKSGHGYLTKYPTP